MFTSTKQVPMYPQRPTRTPLMRQTDGTLRLAPSRETRRCERAADSSGALQHWLSRSQSSVHSAPGGLGFPSGTLLPPPSPQSRSLVWEGRRSVSALPGRTRLEPSSSARKDQKSSGLGRPTKSSTLRFNSCPEARVMPNYTAKANKRKNFERRHRNFSTSAILSSSVPNGESFHSFITGARYNSAHTIDSRSLERLGVYIPRQDVSRTFVNPAGIIPPSQAVFGRCYHQDGSHEPQSLPPETVQSVEALTHTAPLEGSSTQEIDQVFGPDEGSSESETSLNPRESQVKENIMDAQMSTSSILAAVSSEDFDIAHTTQQGVSKTTHQDAIPKISFPPVLGEVAPIVSVSGANSDQTAAAVRVPKQDHPSSIDSDQPLDFISPEAQRIADEILTEAQNSCSSLTSSMKSHLSGSSPGHEHSLPQSAIPPLSPSTSSPPRGQQQSAVFLTQKHCHPVTTAPQTHEGDLTDNGERPMSPLRQPGSADPSDAQLVEDERSSSIFIDLSGLQQTQQMNDEGSDSEDSGSVS